MEEEDKNQQPAGFEPTDSRVMLHRHVLYRSATTAAQMASSSQILKCFSINVSGVPNQKPGFTATAVIPNCSNPR